MDAQFAAVRSRTEDLCEPLAIEDLGVQPMDDASPPKWHLAHTSWFFETFILKPFMPGYREYHPQFERLFNSYYNGVGHPYPRAKRGLLSRPTVADVLAYRRHIDAAMDSFIAGRPEHDVRARIVLGMHHEQQHQELILTDLKYNLGNNPLHPPYREDLSIDATHGDPVNARQRTFTRFDGGVVEIGAREGFCFDNEQPQHEVLLGAFEIADRLVTNREYVDFVDAGGYNEPSLWLSDAWSWLEQVRRNGDAAAPLYWRQQGGEWFEYCLSGLEHLDDNAPVSHVSFYEADAFARWSNLRLPTEQEWERAAADIAVVGNFVEADLLHPRAARAGQGLTQMFGDLWEWTVSAYGPYPGYQPLPGTLGEYNGKFMSNQRVLRGGSCATAEDHVRASYRNFFYPPDRWQFTGIRLARDVA